MRGRIVAALAAAVAVSTLGIGTASASPSGELWDLANAQHVAAGCAPYTDNSTLGNTALDISKTIANPPGGIAGNGRVPTEGMLADKGYFVSTWGEADYYNSEANGSPKAAMDFWLANPTKAIFSNCDIKEMATAVWIQNGRWVAVLLAASPGGKEPAPAEQPH